VSRVILLYKVSVWLATILKGLYKMMETYDDGVIIKLNSKHI
jgi:hypothetical protein